MPEPSAAAVTPITREALRAVYERYPDPQLSAELRAARADVARSAQELAAPPARPPPAPRRMDECMYAARCACEESGLAPLARAAAALEAFQAAQRAHVQAAVARYLPSDVRGWLFEQARAAGEARNASALADLQKRGGTIREKYQLLWRQQWARREALAAVGSASGIWKLAVRYLAGVPQHLVDFAAAINKPDGPTEELRLKFGPTLAQLVDAAAECNALQAALSHADNAHAPARPAAQAALARCAELLAGDTERFCNLLTQVVQASPFFVDPKRPVPTK